MKETEITELAIAKTKAEAELINALSNAFSALGNSYMPKPMGYDHQSCPVKRAQEAIAKKLQQLAEK
jgi:3-dehydroquinate dehydratase